MKGLDIFSPDGPKIAEGIDLVNANLERLLFQGLREVPGHLEIGSRVPEYFWEPAINKTANIMVEEIKFLIQTYENRIELKEIVVNILDMDVANKGIHITLKYNLKQSEDITTVEFNRIVSV